jgi:hypothetical protein
LGKVQSNDALAIAKIAEAKKVALRRGVWFRALSRVERGIIDLTVRYVEAIKSSKLATIVTAIIEKLQITVETKIQRLVRTIGLPLTRKISAIAASWGNKLANQWAGDISFAKYLTLCANFVG